MTDVAARNAWVQRVLGVTAGAEDPAPQVRSLVAYRKALLGFEQARKAVDGQIEALRKALITTMPHEAALAARLAEDLAALNEGVGDAIDDAMSSAQDDRPSANAEAVEELKAYIAELARNPLVRHVDANPFVPTGVVATLTAALDQVVATVV